MIDRDHPLSAAKGIINAAVVGLGFWVLVIGIAMCALTID